MRILNKVLTRLFILFFPLIFSRCQDSLFNSQLKIAPEYQDISAIVRAGDSLSLGLKTDSSLKPISRVQWWASDGIIRNRDLEAIYIAPQKKEKVLITIKVTNASHVEVTDSLQILVYKQFIILKADDLEFDSRSVIARGWQRFLNFIRDHNLKASLGLIGESLQKGNWQYVIYLQRIAHDGHFEIWNHGYNHLLNERKGNGEIFDEFKNTTYSYQKDHLLRTQNLAKNRLGIMLHTFGAPGNAFDENTQKALQDIPDIKVWFFGRETPGKLVLERSQEVESPIFFPNFSHFKATYDYTRKYLVLQIHPAAWDEARFGEFIRIIDFLIQRDVTFITAYEYFKLASSPAFHNHMVISLKKSFR